MKDLLHAEIKISFMNWIQSEIYRVKEDNPEMRVGRIAQKVTDTAFAVLLGVWETSHGAKQMAEEFYQVADEMVAKANR
jgi:ribosome-associated toxin RatA of RatAB toxin-antitoxin module